MSNGTYWDLEASAGAVGTSMLWRGAWSSALSYNPNDAVSRSGSSYISKTNNSNADPATDGGTNWDVLASGSLAMGRNHLSGLTLSNNITDAVNDINIAAGECRSDDNTADIYLLIPLTKRLDATWTAGTNQGGRDTGAIADGSWHVFAIYNPTTLVSDVLFSLSISAPTMPSGFTKKRRIGAVIRHVTNFGGIRAFKQLGDYFQWTTPIADVNAAAFAPATFNPAPIWVPRFLKIRAHIIYQVVNNTAAANVEIRDPDIVTSYTSIGVPIANVTIASTISVWTSETQGVLLHFKNGGGITTISVITLGYWDYRGTED